MSKRKRVSFSIRLQPYEETVLAEVAKWLNSLDRDEANRLIGEAIIMAYLPYARADAGETTQEIERCCWETQDRLNNHGFNMRQALRVSQPQWDFDRGNFMISAQNKQKSNQDVTQSNELNEPCQFTSQIEGNGSYDDVDSVFGDDSF